MAAAAARWMPPQRRYGIQCWRPGCSVLVRAHARSPSHGGAEDVTVPHECDHPEAVGEVIPLQCNMVPQGRSSPRTEDDSQSDVPVLPLELVRAPAVSHGSSEAAAFKAETIVVEATLHLETRCANELFFFRDDPDHLQH